MLTDIEGQELMKKLIELRNEAKNSSDVSALSAFKAQEQLCIEKFKYIVLMKASHYKGFSNYEDLVQEGLMALTRALSNYNPKKGSIYYWIHRYVDTKVSRQANFHTVIRYPLKVAKEIAPHRENNLPLLIEERHCPDKEAEASEIAYLIDNAISVLDNNQSNIIRLAFGFNGDKPLSVNKICKRLHISRAICIKTINASLDILKEQIKL